MMQNLLVLIFQLTCRDQFSSGPSEKQLENWCMANISTNTIIPLIIFNSWREVEISIASTDLLYSGIKYVTFLIKLLMIKGKKCYFYHRSFLIA